MLRVLIFCVLHFSMNSVASNEIVEKLNFICKKRGAAIHRVQQKNCACPTAFVIDPSKTRFVCPSVLTSWYWKINPPPGVQLYDSVAENERLESQRQLGSLSIESPF